MSDLSPELQQLVSAGKLADKPTVADQERIFAALASRLPLAAGPIVGAPTASSGISENASALSGNLSAPAARPVFKTLGLTVAAVALLTTGYLGLRESPRLPHGASAKPRVQDAQPSSPDALLPQAPPRATEPHSPPAAAKAPAAAPVNGRSTTREPGRTTDSLAKEVAILSRAQTALHGGRAEDCLRILTEHAREYPRGILAEERRTTQIQALCALGRTNEANALLGRISKQSVNGEAARQACATKR